MMWAILIAVVVMGSLAIHAASEVGESLVKSLDGLHEKVDSLQEKVDEIESSIESQRIDKQYVNPIDL